MRSQHYSNGIDVLSKSGAKLQRPVQPTYLYTLGEYARTCTIAGGESPIPLEGFRIAASKHSIDCNRASTWTPPTILRQGESRGGGRQQDF